MKKLLALLLSIAMVASMFVGVALAGTPTAVLTIRTTGVVAFDSIITIEGSVLGVTPPGTVPTAILYAVLQHRAPAPGSPWLAHVPAIEWPVGPILNPTAVRLTAAGDYRIALTGTNRNIALTAVGTVPVAPAVPLVHTIGTIAPAALTVTPGVTSVIRDLVNQVDVPLTITRIEAGVPVHVAPGAALYQAVVTATFAGASIAAPTFTGAGPTLRATFVVPPTPVSGTLAITARTGDGNFAGTASVLVAPRAAFNAIIAPTPALALGTASTFGVTVFDALGAGPGPAPATFAYARATLTGPFTAPPAIVITGAAPVNFAPVTPRHGGTITATVEFFSAAHAVLHTETRTFTVAGWNVEVPVTTLRRGAEGTLRAIVTDAAGNRVNNANVEFVGGADMFSIRTAAGPFAAATTSTVSVNGMFAVQPRGSAVVNGEYSIDVITRTTGTIGVIVWATMLDAAGVPTTIMQANWAGAITVAPTLGYTLTLTHTLLAGATAAEDVRVTVVDTAGAPVTVPLTFTATGLVIEGVSHIGGGEWSVRLHRALGAGTFTLVARNAAATIEGSAPIAAVAPTVTVTPAGGLLTANFRDEITVSVVDPRTGVPVSRLITVAPRTVTPPNAAAVPTAVIVRSRSRAVTVPVTAWPGPVEGAPVPVAASSQQFCLLAHATAVSIGGVAQVSNVRITVAGAPAVDLAFAAATLVVAPAELVNDRLGTVTVQLNDARGVAMVGRGITFDGGLIETATHTIPAGGTLSVVIRPVIPTVGVIPAANVRVNVTPDRAGADVMRATIPVVAAPADTVAPVITTNAPATTTAATLPVTITATDDVRVSTLIVDGVSVAIIPAASVSAVRTLTLAVGVNTFIVQAADAAGNATTHTITITRTAPPAPPADTVAPAITHNAPATTTLESVSVTVTATDAVGVTRVIVGGVEVPVVPAATVSAVRTLPLVVGANAFVVQAADAAGNVGTVTITITRTVPPPPAVERVLPTIEVTAPSITTDATAMITIIARDNVAVTGMIFEGVPVSFFPAATVTVFRTVTLREGLNSFALSVTDAAGNAAHRVIVIDRRTPAPVVHSITIGRANPAIGLDVPATVRNGRLMVPFRWFAERILEARVDFRVVGAAEIVTMHRGNMHVELTLNSTIAKVNGVPVALDVAPFATGGRTLVPARFLAETFGYVVNWNPVTDEVTFTLKP